MPKNKGFKRLVREQAAKTGQKYSTVHAQLDRRGFIPPEEVVPGWSFIGNIVIISPGRDVWDEKTQRIEGDARVLGGIYAELLGQRIIRQDWIKVGSDPDVYPQLAFECHGDAFPAVRWPDPEHPQQIHMDFTVPDLDEAESMVLALGARRLQGKGDFRTFADAAGHPFCMYQGNERRIARVVMDCFSPRMLATFYERLLGMRRVVDSPELVVCSKDEHPHAPLLAFQHVPGYVPPRWPSACGCGGSMGALPEGTSRVEAQAHLDLWFEDAQSAKAVAQRLGAIQAGADHVYADPAGHPFCILAVGQ